jgi:signal transduction histidine kinase
VLVAWLGVVVSRSIARPLRRVTLAATAVADLASHELQRVTDVESDDEASPPRLTALTMRTSDEIGELASAFNRVQATAALLMEQQVTTRRNVAVMFGHIANRTQSLASRQLAQIDELERNEDDEERLESLYRLDHLTARLRRSADSLLVIAGTRDDARLAGPSPLAEVIRSAAAEVEGYQNIVLREICDVIIVAAAVPDLTLLLAELLDNAITFSPPDEPVEVFASVRADCVIRIVDRGIGMTAERLGVENDRLVSRERLDVAPTTMLGLFVVGRLARRHGIDVRLLPTPGVGVTAEVLVPIFIQVRRERAPVPAAGPPAAPLRAPLELDAAPARFSWFDHHQPAPAASRLTANGSRTERAEPARGGLRQRRPGQSLNYDGNYDGSPLDPTGAQNPIRGTAWVPTVRDPEAERAGLNAFTEGAVRATGDSRALERSGHLDGLGRLSTELFVAGPDSRAGLRRRHPGTHLAQNLREEMGGPDPVRATSRIPKARMRDAEAERTQLDGYLEGLARAGDPGSQSRDLWSR